uniref:Asparagine synthetase domain-containing protein n=1 Tax=Pseudo-nitzschia australis TaxID=44445 RepID=A0A7S4AQG9_9STRA|mmetsp:Transcript_7893/g.16945  ORF Transcript_7893/g.16945 Transcript_7893/m.16945 type:complete len:439 (+) Transcript_7893:208-1524(+)
MSSSSSSSNTATTTGVADAKNGSSNGNIISNYEPIDFDAMGLEWKHEENESKKPRAIRMASECRRRLTQATANIIDKIKQRKQQEQERNEGEGEDASHNNNNNNNGTDGTLGLILSGGVDTCAILEAATSLGVVFDVAITVVIGDTSPDDLYSKYAAFKHGLSTRHVVVKMTPEDLVETHLPRTIETLKVWTGMTIRNSLVISAAFQEAQKQGLTDVLVGDGADELFGGYTFTWGDASDPVGWKAKRDKMCRAWTFATDDLAASYGLIAHAPYEDQEEMVDWALNEALREDCIADDRCLIQLLLGEPYNTHTTGKVLLREAFRTGSSWRRKDPIEKGSGATVIGHDEYWEEQVSDREFKTETRILQIEEGVAIKTKENLVNFRIYRKIFGGILHPTRKRLAIGEGCIDCRFELDYPGAMFCHMCGAYPAQRPKEEEQS